MPDYVCSNCGRNHPWHEAKKFDPKTKQHVCRKCNAPLGSEGYRGKRARAWCWNCKDTVSVEMGDHPVSLTKCPLCKKYSLTVTSDI